VVWLLLGSEQAGEGAAAGGTVLIRMAPGRGYPAHRHLDIEEVLVLAGGYRDELGEHRAGEYVRYPAGCDHAPVALGDPARPTGPENPACVLYASARGGIALLGVGAGHPALRANLGLAPSHDSHDSGDSQ
jgi:anti-sigma factor ChrR (cupin superfamily)